jgi:hypothetical protein
VHAQRLAFLDDIESDLSTTTSSRSVEVGSRPATVGYSKRLIRRISVAGAVLMAAVSLSTLPAGAAHASTASGVRPAVPFCWLPYPIPFDHSKTCDNFITFYNHDFITAYAAGPGGQRTCYVFLSTLFTPCGADPGRYNTACTG